MLGHDHPSHANTLLARRIGIDTSRAMSIFMRRDCHVCRSEGFRAHMRVEVRSESKSIHATIVLVDDKFLNEGEVGFSDSAWTNLGVRTGQPVSIHNLPSLDSLGDVRSKIYGHRFSANSLNRVIQDVSDRLYSDIQLSAFVAACAGDNMDRDEIIHLTKAMVDAGDRLTWDYPVVADKHCVGGLPGNRTTPIVVAIIAAYGLPIPKTSSRAITSPSGTADTMETLAPIDLNLAAMRRVVDAEGGCIAWGGSVRLSPADDILIRIERALDIDSDGQLVASVLSKKIAAGATHLIIDLPVGPTAKIRSQAAADNLIGHLKAVAEKSNLVIRAITSDGSQPVGRGIGPSLEARDVLSVLQNKPDAPPDLGARAITLAGELISLCENIALDVAISTAAGILQDGQAWDKFQAICEAQGGMRVPPQAPCTLPVFSRRDGVVKSIDNRRLSRLAKLAGAPDAKSAGVELLVRVGEQVSVGSMLLVLHAESQGELEYALEYFGAHPNMIDMEGLE